MNRPSIGRAHLSIGEVLSLLQDEFPDVTISKIRFLESQGLLDPERTPSGYRKFYEYDIERLRWILRLQKDHYLPLKVIKDRLDEAGGIPPADMVETPDDVEAEASAAERTAEANAGTLFATSENGSSGRVALGDRSIRVVAPPATSAERPSPQQRSGQGQGRGRQAQRPAARSSSASQSSPAPTSTPTDGRTPADSRPAAGQPAQPGAAARSSAPSPQVRAAGQRPAPSGSGQAPVRRPPQGAAEPTRSPGQAQQPRSRQAQRPAASRGSGRQQAGATGRSQPRAAAAAAPATAPTAPSAPTGDNSRPLAGVNFEAGADAVSVTLDELAEASGLTPRDLRDLERFGLIEPREGDETHYDGDALIVARTAAGFLQHGIEARHMRSYKVAVDREAGLFEQIVSPVLKQRNPEARVRAARTITELIRLGEVMRGVLMRRELRDHLGGS